MFVLAAFALMLVNGLALGSQVGSWVARLATFDALASSRLLHLRSRGVSGAYERES